MGSWHSPSWVVYGPLDESHRSSVSIWININRPTAGSHYLHQFPPLCRSFCAFFYWSICSSRLAWPRLLRWLHSLRPRLQASVSPSPAPNGLLIPTRDWCSLVHTRKVLYLARRADVPLTVQSTNGDITSMLYNGIQAQDQSKFSQIVRRTMSRAYYIAR